MPRKIETEKEHISISLEKDLLKKLDEFCKKSFNAQRSAVIEKALKRFLEEKM